MELNKLYDKKYLVGVCKSLALLGDNEQKKFYEPARDLYIKLDKQQVFFKCWQEYFRELMPLFKNKKKGILLTHLIFGNEVAKIETTLFSNALYFRVSIKGLYNKIKINKKNITEYEKEQN